MPTLEEREARLRDAIRLSAGGPVQVDTGSMKPAPTSMAATGRCVVCGMDGTEAHDGCRRWQEAAEPKHVVCRCPSCLNMRAIRDARAVKAGDAITVKNRPEWVRVKSAKVMDVNGRVVASWHEAPEPPPLTPWDGETYGTAPTRPVAALNPAEVNERRVAQLADECGRLSSALGQMRREMVSTEAENSRLRRALEKKR